MTATVWLALVIAGIGTFLERFSFLAVARRAAAVPPVVREGLRMIPPAALAALVAPAVLRGGAASTSITFTDGRLVGALLALLVMKRTGNVLLTLAVGMAAVLAAAQLSGGG